MKNFAERLLFARTQRGLTQQKLAALCHISQSTIASYESGARLHARNLIELANALHVNAQWLSKGTGPMFTSIQESTPSYMQTWPFTRVSPNDIFELSSSQKQLVENVIHTLLTTWANEKK